VTEVSFIISEESVIISEVSVIISEMSVIISEVSVIISEVSVIISEMSCEQRAREDVSENCPYFLWKIQQQKKSLSSIYKVTANRSNCIELCSLVPRWRGLACVSVGLLFLSFGLPLLEVTLWGLINYITPVGFYKEYWNCKCQVRHWVYVIHTHTHTRPSEENFTNGAN
jgi:hypothetical protein